jgi:hypothetical protein
VGHAAERAAELSTLGRRNIVGFVPENGVGDGDQQLAIETADLGGVVGD